QAEDGRQRHGADLAMPRPESPHVITLKGFRERLVEARRAAAREPDIDRARTRFVDIETAIGLVDRAIENELDLTPLPAVDDPTAPPPPEAEALETAAKPQ